LSYRVDTELVESEIVTEGPLHQHHQEVSSARSLSGLARKRDWATEPKAPEPHSEMFRDWQEITNSIFCGGPLG
jgi:hypothetical protein